MKKIDTVVAKETKYIAYFVVILSIAMEAVFLLLKRWDYRVLLGNILSASAAILNFLFMGITVQNAVSKDEKDARMAVKASQSLRTFFLFAVGATGALVPIFNTWASIIPLLFPRIAIAFRPLFDKR